MTTEVVLWQKEDDAMSKTMTPSGTPITAGQIGKLQDILAAGLRKCGLQSEPFQRVLETQGDQLVIEMVAVVRKHVDAVSDIIVRRVKVDRNRSPQEVLAATGRRQYTGKTVNAMPRGEGNDAEVYFFKLGRFVSDTELEADYELRGLKPADPYSLAAVNEADPDFADEHPNGTHWKDTAGRWCYAGFDRWNGERGVNVHCSAIDWDGSWWFAGLRIN